MIAPSKSSVLLLWGIMFLVAGHVFFDGRWAETKDTVEELRE